MAGETHDMLSVEGLSPWFWQAVGSRLHGDASHSACVGNPAFFMNLPIVVCVCYAVAWLRPAQTDGRRERGRVVCGGVKTSLPGRLAIATGAEDGTCTHRLDLTPTDVHV